MQIDVFSLLPLDIYHTKRTDSVLEKAPSSPTLTTAPRTDRESHGFHSLLFGAPRARVDGEVCVVSIVFFKESQPSCVNAKRGPLSTA